MAFSPGNYVDQRPDGTFGVVLNGVFHGPFGTQQEAEQFFNTAQAQQGANDAAAGGQNEIGGSVPRQPGQGTPNIAAPTGGGGKVYRTPSGDKTIAQMNAELRAAGWGGPWDDNSVIAKYNELGLAARRGGGSGGTGGAAGDDVAGFIDANLKSNRERFDYDKTRDARSMYSDVARTLLSTASGLRGPRDWMAYAQNAAGGRSLTQQLFGSEGVPAFGSPTNPNAAITMDDLLRDLGLGGGGQPGAPGQPAQQTFTMDEMTSRLREAGYDGPWDEPSVRAAWQRTYKPPAQAAPAATSGGTGATTPATAIPQVPMAHQVNPAVWDSMSGVAKALTLGLAEQGQTSAGAYDAEDYIRQMNATRPVGASQRSPRVAYAMPRGVR